MAHYQRQVARRQRKWQELSAQPGVVPLVGVYENDVEHGALWSLTLSSNASDGGLPLGQDLLRSLAQARFAIPRSLPILSGNVQVLERARYGQIAPFQYSRSRISSTSLDGASYGLSLALSLVSLIFEKPVPCAVIASATIDEEGRLGPVRGLEAKIRAISSSQLGFQKFLVCSEQRDEALELLRGARVEVPVVRTLAEAIRMAFPKLVDRWISANSTKEQRDNFIHEIWRLALDERGHLSAWFPVAEAARRAQELWQRVLSKDDHEKLRLTWAFSMRHASNAGETKIPEKSWLDGLPVMVRMAVTRNLVQQYHDTGTPVWSAIESYAKSLICEAIEDFPELLKLRGALARVQAIHGDLESALCENIKIIRAWLENLHSAETSHPFSEAWRVVAVLGDQERAAELENLYLSALRNGGWDEAGRWFVDVYRAEARIALMVDVEATADRLREYARNRRLPGHLRAKAIRVLLTHCDSPEDRELLSGLSASDQFVARAMIDLYRNVNVEAAIEMLESLESLKSIVKTIRSYTTEDRLAKALRERIPYY